ncbi:MAG: short-chain dehydrogenase/reductase [Actinomycetia bacterium]|nr:short-chain dehydrogenase/reductase [Actinomycetes bacterium]
MELTDGSVAVVTGAASGIGTALAHAFAAAGCAVVVADVDAAALDAVAGDIKGDVVPVVTDVSDAAAVEHLAEEAFGHFGAVHVLCNNAGVSTFNPVAAQTLDDWHWVLGVNLWGVIHGVQAFLPRLLAQGEPAHIVSTSSLAGLASGLPSLGPYNVSKVGVVALSETLRMELAMAGAPIGVSVLCPGTTPTQILDSERNRPTILGREARVAEGDAMRDAVRAGFDGPGARTAEEVAADVLAAVRAGDFWIITSGEMRELVSNRFQEIDGATPS